VIGLLCRCNIRHPQYVRGCLPCGGCYLRGRHHHLRGYTDHPAPQGETRRVHLPAGHERQAVRDIPHQYQALRLAHRVSHRTTSAPTSAHADVRGYGRGRRHEVNRGRCRTPRKTTRWTPRKITRWTPRSPTTDVWGQ